MSGMVDSRRSRARLPETETTLAVAPSALAALALLVLAFQSGDTSAVSWCAVSLGLLGAGVALMRRHPRPRVTQAQRLVTTAALGLTAWTALSTTWSAAPGPPMVALQRVLVYTAVALVVAAIATPSTVETIAFSILTAISVVDAYALWTRLLGDHRDSAGHLVQSRLEAPLGYWNGLGILTTLGVLLALGFATRRGPYRLAAAALLPVLATALYLTFSRGAVGALIVGLAVTGLVARQRVRWSAAMLVALAAPLGSVLIAAQFRALTRNAPRAKYPHSQARWLSDVTRDGRIMVVVLAVFAIAGYLAVRALSKRELGIRLTARQRRLYVGTLVGMLVLAAGVYVLSVGSPLRALDNGVSGLAEAPPPSGHNYNRRLSSLALNSRPDFWRAAVNDYRAHPVVGSGAATYQRWWLAHRSKPLDIQYAHNVYLGMLAELGPVGLVLLLCVLVPPLVAAARARTHPLVPALAGAYAAYLVHAGFDWDWEVPAVTVAAIPLGGALLALHPSRMTPVSGRMLLVTGALAVFAGFALVGNVLDSRAADDLAAGNPAGARSLATWAGRWQPWSASPDASIARADIAQRRFPDARRALRSAIAKDSTDWQLWYQLSTITRGAERAQALARARTLDPFLTP